MWAFTKMYRHRIIDFRSSSVSWLGESVGTFKIASVLEIFRPDGTKELFALTENVLAGNVYAKQKLIKSPPYLFQLIMSKNYQKIMRTDLDNHLFWFFPKRAFRNKVRDTEGKIFRDRTHFNLKYRKSRINDVDDIFLKNLVKFDRTARLSFSKNQIEFSAEFPIRHLNTKSHSKEWQVETGPVLFPVFSKKVNKIELVPSFVFFNSLSFVDILLDYPTKKRNIHGYVENMINNFRCSIEMF